MSFSLGSLLPGLVASVAAVAATTAGQPSVHEALVTNQINLDRPEQMALAPSIVELTWMSMANMHYQIADLGILTDGYITRIPEAAFYGGGGGLAYTREPYQPDVEAVARVLNAIGGRASVDMILTGHSHFDHSFDAPTWARLTGAPIIGPTTSCLQATAAGLPASACTAIFGGERIELAEGVTMWVVRWNHSGDPALNPEQHDPVELDQEPIPAGPDSAFRAGVAEDFPNGGGSRSFLFRIDGPDGPYSWFYQGSASALNLHLPIVVNGVDYGAPLDNLRSAMRDADLDSVDLWIATGGEPVAALVVPIINPKYYLPVHWDGLWSPFEAGMPMAFEQPALEGLLSDRQITLLRPRQYMDKWQIDRSGVRPVPNSAVKQALSLTDVQVFDQ